MEVILTKDVPTLGRAGEKVRVKDGYFRNYLGPKGLGLLASSNNLSSLTRQQESIRLKNQNALEQAQSLAAKLKDLVLTLEKETGEEGKLFGSVTNMEIAEALEKQDENFKLDRHHIVLGERIKTLGTYPVAIKLHSDVTAEIKVEVVAKA
ncbi:MAG: 50S ribosomal protein L9 [Deltaproteobacteria bacterium]|nr:50S ribosomal protein L9 [Deltaproteobacteria bacterium]